MMIFDSRASPCPETGCPPASFRRFMEFTSLGVVVDVLQTPFGPDRRAALFQPDPSLQVVRRTDRPLGVTEATLPVHSRRASSDHRLQSDGASSEHSGHRGETPNRTPGSACRQP
jgi:hypothetical protein